MPHIRCLRGVLNVSLQILGKRLELLGVIGTFSWLPFTIENGCFDDLKHH